MDDDRHVGTFSWHQSLDQATLNIFVPYDTVLDDLEIILEPPYLVAGVRGQMPLLKGKIYDAVNKEATHWNFEPTDNPRRRTASTASTVSTQSSYAYVSDPEISSSFAASLESAQVSDNDSDAASSSASPIQSHPVSRDEQLRNAGPSMSATTVPAFPQHAPGSYPASPQLPINSMESSLSSLDSLHPTRPAKLLTIILVKDRATYWPRIIDGPVPESYSHIPSGPFVGDPDAERKYNCDPTTLGLMGEESLKIRNDRDEAFEYFVRSWHLLHTPFSAMRLVSHFTPVTTIIPTSLTPTSTPPPPPRRGTVEYYVRALGGPQGLAQLFLEAGIAHLDGIASKLLASNYSPLASIRRAEPPPSALRRRESSTAIWKRDRACARTYFERARTLAPALDAAGAIPLLPEETDLRGIDEGRSGSGRSASRDPEFQMPSIYVEDASTEKTLRPPASPETIRGGKRRRRQEASETLLGSKELEKMKPGVVDEDDDDTWWLIGAGTAILVASVLGAIGFSSWRKNNS